MSLNKITAFKWIICSLGLVAMLFAGSASTNLAAVFAQENSSDSETALTVQYLEIVARDVEEVAALYSQIYGVAFGEADPNLGGARTAKLVGGGMIGIRAPLRDDEQPIVRPYILVEDIDASVSVARTAGAEIAMPPLEIEGYGQFAIIIREGIESGLWQLEVAE